MGACGDLRHVDNALGKCRDQRLSHDSLAYSDIMLRSERVAPSGRSERKFSEQRGHLSERGYARRDNVREVKASDKLTSLHATRPSRDVMGD